MKRFIAVTAFALLSLLLFELARISTGFGFEKGNHGEYLHPEVAFTSMLGVGVLGTIWFFILAHILVWIYEKFK